MLVFCKMGYCPYSDQRGFCGKRTIQIDENGMCTVLWRKGQQVDMRKWQLLSKLDDKQIITLLETEYQTIEEEVAEDQLKQIQEAVITALQKDDISEQQKIEEKDVKKEPKDQTSNKEVS